jgi:hypothetical protein
MRARTYAQADIYFIVCALHNACAQVMNGRFKERPFRLGLINAEPPYRLAAPSTGHKNIEPPLGDAPVL